MYYLKKNLMVYCPFHEGKLETFSCEVANGSPNVIMITSLLRSCVSREVQTLIVLIFEA